MGIKHTLVPSRLVRPHPYVVATRDAILLQRVEDDGRLRLRPRPGLVHMAVSRPQLRRALLYVQALIAAAGAQGLEVRPTPHERYGDRRGVSFGRGAHFYPIQLVELTTRVPYTDAELARWIRDNDWRLKWRRDPTPPTHHPVANGYLRISLPDYRSNARSNWAEGPRGPLERKFESFFAEITRRLEEDMKLDAERDRRAALRQEHELRMREAAAQEAAEKAKVDEFAEQVAAWRLAQDAREYAAALRARAAELDPENRGRLVEWCDWAVGWADASDPVLNAETHPALRPTA
jgi:hypothetical protein